MVVGAAVASHCFQPSISAAFARAGIIRATKEPSWMVGEEHILTCRRLRLDQSVARRWTLRTCHADTKTS